jgi:multidrug resistance efflux pump
MTNDVQTDRSVEPLPQRPRRSPLRLLILLAVVGGLAWAGVAFYQNVLTFGKSDAERGALTYVVTRNPLQVIASAEGNVESASNLEVKCRVAGGSTILWIVEDGKVVEEGEEIVKLDTSVIDDKLNSQRIVYEKALATEIQAQEDLEATKISVREYEEGTFVELHKQAEAGIQIALENLRSAENQMQYSQRMVRKGFVSALQRDADAFAVERAKLDLDAANTKKNVLVEFTKPKTLKDLVAKREAAAARLRSEQAGLTLEKARLERLQEQLKHCVITAPTKGMVVYASDSRSRFGGSRDGGGGQIEEGAVVREGQSLVRLPDLSRMQVKVMVHETRVDQIRGGMPARVIIQDAEHQGKVVSVANQPQQSSWFSANVKEYATTVSIQGETSGLRPGMTAKVTILIDDVKEALSVPVSVVVEQRGGFYSWVKTAKGPERRELKLGRTNDKLIEVVDGVKEGDEVYRNPRAMVEEAREEPPFEKQVEDPKFAAPALAAEPTTGAREKGAAGPAAGAPGAAPPGAGGSLEARPVPAAASAERGGPGGPGEGPRGERGERGDRPPGEGGRRRFDLMQNDKNGDKKLTRDELPEFMQGMMDRADTNADGAIDEAEIAEMRKSMGGGRRRGGGEGGPGGPGGPEGAGDGPPRGGRGDREGGGGSPDGGGNSRP